MAPAIVAAVITAVASVAVTAMSAKSQKKTANRNEELNQRVVDNREDQRKLDEDIQAASLGREARAKRAEMLNKAAQTGLVQSDTFRGAYGAIDTNRTRELNLLNQKSELADVADDITREQIANDASASVAAADNSILGAGISAVAEVGSALYKEYGDTDAPVPQNIGTSNQTASQYIAAYPNEAL